MTTGARHVAVGVGQQLRAHAALREAQSCIARAVGSLGRLLGPSPGMKKYVFEDDLYDFV